MTAISPRLIILIGLQEVNELFADDTAASSEGGSSVKVKKKKKKPPKAIEEDDDVSKEAPVFVKKKTATKKASFKTEIKTSKIAAGKSPRKKKNKLKGVQAYKQSSAVST